MVSLRPLPQFLSCFWSPLLRGLGRFLSLLTPVSLMNNGWVE